MSDAQQSSQERERSLRMRAVLESVYHRRSAGEAVDDQTVIDAHPDLMPELGEKLRSLRRVRQAQQIARQSFGASEGRGLAGRGLDLPEDAVPGYELDGKIHEGGQGIVYRARQRSTNRLVAVKVLRTGPHVFTGDQIRFEQEAQVLGRLKHPNIVTVHDFGVAQGCRFLVMDLIEGRPLDVHLRETDPDQETKVLLFLKICDAVHAAHLVGVIHRDLKPSNILIDENGEPLVVDFGLAKLREDELEHGSGPAVTMTGQLVGSLPWLSPEQAAGGSERVSTRTDVHALGLILYYMVTKRSAYSLVGSLRDQLDTVLHDAPARPSTIAKAVDDDLERIILKCLAKEPDRRYQGAGDVAKDLRRYLRNEPIEAKRDSTLYRVRKYVQRHRRILATAGLTTAVFLAAVAAAVWTRRAAEERARLAEVEAVFSEADDLITETRKLRTSFKQLENKFRIFKIQRVAQYFPPEKDRRMHRIEDEIAYVRATREENFYTVLELLHRAEKLGADPDRVRHMRGELFLQEYLDELNEGNRVVAERLRERMLANDPTGQLRTRVTGTSRMNLRGLPPGTTTYLFRVVEQAQVVSGGEHRMVPVPVGKPSLPVPPGTWTLHVLAGSGSIRAGDLILSLAGHPIQGTVLVQRGMDRIRRFDRLVSVDGNEVRSLYDAGDAAGATADTPRDRRFEFERAGQRFAITAPSLETLGIDLARPGQIAVEGGVSAEVWQDGNVQEVVLPTGLWVRTTTRPFFICPETKAQITPDSMGNAYVALENGSYVLLFRKPGHEDVIHPFDINDEADLLLPSIQLPLTGTAPRGFRHVLAFVVGKTLRPFWIKEHEVTAAEYLRFLNDPTTLGRIANVSEPVLFPRSSENAETGGYWPRTADGSFELPASWDPNRPVFGVSWYDATAYAQWKTETARASGLDHTYSLPTLDEWMAACLGLIRHQKFHFGYRFRAKWMSSCFARPTPGIEPVKSFPIDETIYGVYDTAGSVSEWLDGWWLEDRGLRRHAGGSWADGGPEDMFGVEGGGGMRPDQVSNTVGFRVVLRMRSAEAQP